LKIGDNKSNKQVKNRLEKAIEKPIKENLNHFPECINNIYDDKYMRKYEDIDILMIKAATGLGKTKQLVNYIDELIKDFVLTPPNIIIISFRRTFSADIQRVLSGKDFTLYSDVGGYLNQSRLIVQVESLHRIPITLHRVKPDLIVMDECESIFEQFNSGLSKNFIHSWTVFQWLLRYSKKIICMDAYLSDRTFTMLKQFRPESKYIFHYNKYKTRENDKFFLTISQNDWVNKLKRKISKGKKIAIPTNSLDQAKALYNMIEYNFDTYSVKLYSSEMSESEKKKHFSDVNVYWKNYDIIIYTPTVSAGVSFEEEYFDYIFGYFTDASCNVQTCMQMIGRIRNVKCKKYYICLNASYYQLSTSR
jgi:hypothetical protein